MKTLPYTAEPDVYFQLVRQFPLRPLRRQADLEAANRMALQLVTSAPEDEMDAGVRDYLDALSVLIQDAERHVTESLARKIGAVDLLKHLMKERGMSVSDLGRVVGSQPAASLILSGKRSISKPQMRKLADYFGVTPTAFMN